MALKSGDVVTLRSGGPRMTVVEQSGDDVVCQWFVKTNIEKKVFKEATLQLASQRGVVARR
jgi:uncharacterized protein YodC (DUF2158 family)